MSNLARSVKARITCEHAGLPQFPVTLDPKTGTELCRILSGITARGHFTRYTPVSSRHAL